MILFSSWNYVGLLLGMLANVSTPQSWGWALLCRRWLYLVVKDLRRLTYVLLSPASLSIIYYSHPYPLPLLSANVNDSKWCHPHLFPHAPSELPSIATSTPPPCAFFIYDATAASTTAITPSWQRLWFCWTSLVSCEWKTWEEKIVSVLELELAFLFATPPALVAWCIVIQEIIPTTIICTPSHPHPGQNPDQRSRRRLGGVRTALRLWGRQQTVTEEGLPQYYPHSFFLEEPRLCVFRFPFLFVQKWQSKNKFVQSCCQESLLYEIGNGSHFISLRNQDGSNYPFADDVKNHICLVSPAQSKKIPKWLIRQS